MSIEKERELLLPLLLEADPDEHMVRRYLYDGLMLAAVEDGAAVGVAVVVRLPNGSWELKNLAVREDRQHQGVGRELIQAVLKRLPTGSLVWVGTSDSGVPYYEKNGFCYSHTVHDFFTAHYPAPIFENGKLVRDMHYLKKELP